MDGPVILSRFLRQARLSAVVGQASPLVMGRLLSAALTFALPLVLVRMMTPSGFGTYKQFFLVGQTVLLTCQFGVTQSLYYFLPRGGPRRGIYVTHVLLLLTALGLLSGVALYFGASWVGIWLGDGRLPELKVPLAIYSGAMLIAIPLEAGLTSEGRVGAAALSYVVSDAVRAGALVLAARLLGTDHAIFWAAAGVAALRVGALALLVARRFLPTGAPERRALREQLAFSLPFAGAIWLYVAQRYFSQYAVSARFDAATFALYAVASFHLPVVDIVFSPISEVMMVRLGRAHAQSAHTPERLGELAEWHDAVCKLASLLLPAACGAWLLGPSVLPMLFTAKYAAAVPLFLLATFEIPLWILPCDALLRAAGDTSFLFAFNAVRVVLTGALVLLGIHFFGLSGAIVGGIASEAVARVGMIARGRRFLRVPLARTLEWRTLGRIAAAAVGACAPAGLAHLILPPGKLPVVLSMLIYGVSYVLLRAALLRTSPSPITAAMVSAST